MGTLHEDLRTFVIISRSLLRMKKFSDKTCKKNQNTQFIFSSNFPEYRAVYEKICKNMVQPDRPKMTIYEKNSISKLQIVIEKNRMEIMTYKQHFFFNIISIQI